MAMALKNICSNKIVAIHLNHNWRGTESDNEEIRCKEFCEKENIEFYSEKLPDNTDKNEHIRGFPGGASGKEPACQCRRHKRHGLNLWVGGIPWRRAWQPSPVFLPGESHGQRSLAGYNL